MMTETNKITFFSQNCQGLANPQKRRAMFRHVRMKKYNIACLQDVHIQSQQKPMLRKNGVTMHTLAVSIVVVEA